MNKINYYFLGRLEHSTLYVTSLCNVLRTTFNEVYTSKSKCLNNTFRILI